MMRRTVSATVALLGILATIAGAQGAKPATKAAPKQAGAPAMGAAIAWSDLVGDWTGKSMKGKTDSVITEFTTTYKADKSIVMTFPNRPPVAVKLIAMGGDSIVSETEKYDAITRPGHKTWVRTTAHIANHKMTGTFRATFDDGKTLDGHTTASHKMK